MQIEDYFDFLSEDDIRLKGTRIGIETVLYEHIHRGQTPEEITQAYSGLSQEQVYATILYYRHCQEAISNYLKRWLEHCLNAEQAQDNNPSPLVQRLLKAKAEQQAKASSTALASYEISA